MFSARRVLPSAFQELQGTDSVESHIERSQGRRQPDTAQQGQVIVREIHRLQRHSRVEFGKTNELVLGQGEMSEFRQGGQGGQLAERTTGEIQLS